MQLSYSDDFVFIETANPGVKRILDRHHNAVFSKKTGYRLPRTLWVLLELAKSFPTLKDSKVFMAEGKRLRFEQDQLLRMKQGMETPSKKYPTLRPYQWADVMYLTPMKSAGIFNGPRTGKTPTTITLLRELGTKRNLIVAPASLLLNWAMEIKKWWPVASMMEVITYTGTAKKRKALDAVIAARFADKKPTIVIVSKSNLKSGDPLLQLVYDFCAVDEAHFLRNPKTVQTKSIFAIKSERRYALTGTPTVKHPSDIWGILHFLFPKQYPSMHQFNDRYFEIGQDYMGHRIVGDIKPFREKELQEMTGLMSVQRKRKEVMQWLPDKQRTTIPIALEEKQMKLYSDMQKLFFASDDPVEVDAQNVIVQLMRLRQLCLDPRLLGFATAGAKTEALLEFLDSTRQPVIVMSWFTSYLKLLKPLVEKLGFRVGEIHGQMPNDEKAASASLFQNGEYDILLCNIVSAGVGHTLDRAETIIFLDKAWNPTENEQAEDRITPTTEENNHKHEIISFVCSGTIEDAIEKTLVQKKSLTDIINEGGREALRALLGG